MGSGSLSLRECETMHMTYHEVFPRQNSDVVRRSSSLLGLVVEQSMIKFLFWAASKAVVYPVYYLMAESFISQALKENVIIVAELCDRLIV